MFPSDANKPTEGKLYIKTGPLNNDEKKLIRDSTEEGVAISEIAKQIEDIYGWKRRPEAIEHYLRKEAIQHHEFSIEENDYNTYEDKLLRRVYWTEVKNQFDKEELEYFKSTWINLMIQFKENVLFAEELQLKQLVTIDIMLNRCMKERRKHTQDTDRLQTLLDKEYALDEQVRDTALLAQLESQISYARNSLSNYTTEYTKLLDKQKDINKDLKATRDQRIKRVEDSKTSFQGWLRALEDENTKDRIGHDAGIMKLAKQKARQEMSEYHTYVDGQIDQPFLTPETVKDE